jgi:hypothetical protein
MITIDDRAREAAADLRRSVWAPRTRDVRRMQRRVRWVVLPLVASVLVVTLVASITWQEDGEATRTVAPPSGGTTALDSERLAELSGGVDGATWQVWLTGDDVCWSTVVPPATSSSCLPRPNFEHARAVGQTGGRVVVRLTSLAVKSIDLDGVPMQAAETVDVRLFAATAPAAPSAKLVGRSPGAVEFRETVEATVVPRVVGMAPSEAVDLLHALGLDVTAEMGESTQPLIGQDPAPGTKNLQVGHVHLSGGAPDPQVGRVSGDQDGHAWSVYVRLTSDGPRVCYQAAVDAVQSVGNCVVTGVGPLVEAVNTVGFVFVRLADPDGVPRLDTGLGSQPMRLIETDEFRVAWQTVAPGTADASISWDGGTVTRLVPVSVPDLSGLSFEEATEVLADVGLTPTLANRGALGALGTVVQQAPAPGTRDLAVGRVALTIG